jgi:RIO kinase 1
MVAQWAEKEMRNLRRLRAAGIRCPEVVEVRQNVLVMEFMGVDGDAAPKLKDALGIGPQEWTELYIQCGMTMRRMMQECKLVHGDLSEYNMLYHGGELCIIDVSQSTESDHPQSLDFLKRDCVNVNNFFGKVMEGDPISVRKLFDFVVTKDLAGAAAVGGAEAYLRKLLEEAAEGEEEQDDEVFIQTWIPSHLDQVSDRAFIERDIARRKGGEELLYDRLLADVKQDEECDEDNDEEDDEKEESIKCEIDASLQPASTKEPSEDAGDSDSEDDDDDSDNDSKRPDGHIPDGVDKKQWKAQVKAEKAEKRKDKIPKALKKKFRKQAAKGR